MAARCAKCKGSPNIQINVLNYCSTCFISNTTTKASKLLNGMAHDTPILLYVDGGPSAAMLCNILEQFFSTRRYYRVVVCSPSPEMQGKLAFATQYAAIKDLNAESSSICGNAGAQGRCACCETGLPHPVLDFCLSNHIRTVIHPRTLEDVLAASLQCLCGGDGTKAAAAACTESIEGIRIINPLCTMRDKEVAYYLYVKGIARPAAARSAAKIKTVLKDFLHETDSRNSLALFNILGTFRKLG